MKKIIFLVLTSLFGVGSYAQTIENVNLFNSYALNGTPRYTAMGGAFMALGNDFSAMHLNPAASAVYRYDNIGSTLRFQGQSNTSTFLNNQSSTSTFRVLFENIGLVKKFGDKSKMSFGFSYSKLVDFSNQFQVSGTNNYVFNPVSGRESGFTLGEYWLEAAFGNTVGELEIAGWLEEASAASVDILWRDTLGIVQGFDEVDESANAYYSFEERGRHDEYTFNVAGAEEGQLYWGLGIGIPTVHYDNYTTLSESGYASNSYFRAVDLVRNNSLDAVGFNMKAGIIYRPVQSLRVALSYQSPSWYNVRETYSVQTIGFARGGAQDNGNIYKIDDITYGLSTPSIYRAGVAGVFGKNGILSADIEYSNPSKTTLNGKGLNDYRSDESFYQSETKETFAVKLGGELRAGKFFFRAGYQFRNSNFKDERQYTSSLNAYSGGVGFKEGDLSINLSYVQSLYSQVYYVHPYLSYEKDNGAGIENANVSRSLLTNDVSKGSVLIGFNVAF